MRDNTKTPLDRGPKGMDERTRSVESARRIVKASNLHGKRAQDDLPGRRPAHTAGVFLKGEFTPSHNSRRFKSGVFQDGQKRALARFSPLRTVDDDGRFDLHGLSLRLWPGASEADATDLVALNTQPFMFRTADEFETVVRLMRSNSRDKLIGLFEFAAATLAGDASVHGLVNAIGEVFRGNRTLALRNYWGIHTFFADRDSSPSGDGTDTVRVPYRYRLSISDYESSPAEFSRGKVLAKYRDLVNMIDNEGSVKINLWFMLPWQWGRLTDWADVPERIRLDLINPQAVWKDVCEIHMGQVVVDEVLDGNAAWGDATHPKCDGMLFDPTRLSEGLYLSEDPMLIALSSIYAESHMRRMQ